MLKIVRLCLTVLCVFALFVWNVSFLQGAEPKRLSRADSFLGIHFDFHAGPDCTEVGKNTTPEMIERIINMVKPDYLQIDCKGHRGMSSYPTKVGYPAPGIIGDPLRTWRETTAKKGVALYMHYSGVLDMEAVIQNPDWAVVGADGKPYDASDHMKGANSVFGPYVDKLLIPQLKELAGDYNVDGIWIDGECWGTARDYGEKACQLFKEKTGITNIPKTKTDPNWREWLEFHREGFRDYMRHYIEEVKKTNPEFQICGNWAFSDLMPEKVCAPVDFISGDYSPQDSVNSARISARYIAAQKMPWDLMSWSFTTVQDEQGRNFKSSPQLSREAAVVLAMGGGYQTYITQNRDGSIDLNKVVPMEETAKFCRARQPFCHKAEQVPQIAILFSTVAAYRKSNDVFCPTYDIGNGNLKGTLLALLESQYSVELKSECHLEDNMDDYPLIIIPEWEYLDPDFVEKLTDYAYDGGKILIIGGKTMEQLPNSMKEDTNNIFYDMIGVIPEKLASEYAAKRDPAVRAQIVDMVKALFPKPIVEVTGSEFVDVVVNRKDGKLGIHLVNTSGPHADSSHPVIDAIEPIESLTVAIRLDEKPNTIIRQPAGTACDFTYENGMAQLTLNNLEIYDILVVE